MTQLYITFFVIGLLVFGGIVLYSWLQQSHFKAKRDGLFEIKKKKYDDPIFNDNKSKDTKPSSAKGKPVSEPTLEPRIKKEKSVDSSDKKSVDKHVKKDLQIPEKNSGSNRSSLPVVEMNEELDSTNNQPVETKPAKDNSDTADNVEIINARPKRDKGSSSIVTELVARVNNSAPIEQKELLTLFRNHDFKFHREVHVYGLNELTDLWRDIEFELPSARFVELGVAIQLADRDGAMTKKELHDFQQMALEFSNHFDAPFEFSMDIDEALIQAKVLDQIGRRYDSMAVLNVVPRSKVGFRIADIESCARDLGMTRSKNGIFLKTTGQKNQISILYRLACTNSTGDFGLSSSNADPIHDLVIYMNVPATQTPEIVFQDMVKDTNSLATWLEGKVVDKDGAVMTQRSYSVLTQQISDISFSMQQDGLMPGDSVCKKLF